MTTDNSVLVTKVKEKIKALLESQNLTVYELAQKSDLTEACIRNWFTKRNYTPSLEALEKNQQSFRDFSFRASLRQRRVLFRHGRKQGVYR
ncbi:MAG: hypothetical protein HFE26_02560 [Clostridia bacterium]|nr:hypothetical protein [Clostridia bacterium]